MNPCSSMSSIHLLRDSVSLVGSGYTLLLIVAGASLVSLIWWSHGLGGGNRVASVSEKTLACHWYSIGIVCSVLTLALSYAFSDICWAMVVFRICSMGVVWMSVRWVMRWACVSTSQSVVIVVQCRLSGSAVSRRARRTCVCAICCFAAAVDISSFPCNFPFSQLIWGLKVQSHGCPRMSRLAPLGDAAWTVYCRRTIIVVAAPVPGPC
jgi:hypothetical protein